MKTTYWKRESLVDGRIIALFKIEKSEKEMSGYIYKNGGWQEYDAIVAKAGWDDDYDCITEAEANKIMKQL